MTTSFSSRLIAVATGRGGGGKSITSGSLAFSLHHDHGRVTALVDLDPQGSAATYQGLWRSDDPLHEPPRIVHGVQIYAGGVSLAKASKEEIIEHIARAASTAETVILDCPPGCSGAVHDALWSYPIDLLLALMQLEPGGVEPLQTLTGLAESEGVPYVVLANMEENTTNAMGSAIALRATYQGRSVMLDGARRSVLLQNAVPYSEHVRTAIFRRQPLTKFRPKSAAARVLVDLAADLVAWGVA